jgi:hypothetical protein
MAVVTAVVAAEMAAVTALVAEFAVGCKMTSTLTGVRSVDACGLR